MKVYADNAATAPMRESALRAYTETARQIYGNPSSLYTLGQEAKSLLEDCRKTVATLLGAEAKEIIFTSGGSEADNQAILSAARLGTLKGKTKIISSAIEHHAVLHTLNELKKKGFEVVLLPVGTDGIVKTEDLEREIDGNTCLVSVMFANNEIGTLQPVEEIGKICRERKILFHTDAVQAVGHTAVDVKKIGCDYLTLSAHKFGGPKGTGALYVRQGAPVYPLIEGGAQERGKRAGTEDLPAIRAMAVAMKEAVESIPATEKKITYMRNELIDGLEKIPHSALNGDRDKRLAGNVNFCFEGIEGESLLLLLDDRGISASSGSACTSGSLDPSHVLLALGRVHDVAHGSLRLTLSADNTEEEIRYIIQNVTEVVQYLRNMSPVWRDLQEGKRQFIL